jgi:hypothetical protein
MLVLALQLQQVINQHAALDKRYTFNPSEQEWEKLKELMMCLKVFYNVTLKLSSTKYPTLNLFFLELCEMYLSIRKMGTSQYPLRWV